MFTIIKIQHINPVTIYLLEDYRRKSIAFYEHRATHLDVYLVEKVLRRKGDKVYVKWLGFDGSHNSYTKTMSFDKILIRVFLFLHIKNILIYKYIKVFFFYYPFHLRFGVYRYK